VLEWQTLQNLLWLLEALLILDCTANTMLRKQLLLFAVRD
jgi:hypothetical protein